jgi:hypothetical protein
MTTELQHGVRSSTTPLREVLVKRPGPAFGRAFDDPARTASCDPSTSSGLGASTTASSSPSMGLG